LYDNQLLFTHLQRAFSLGQLQCFQFGFSRSERVRIVALRHPQDFLGGQTPHRPSRPFPPRWRSDKIGGHVDAALTGVGLSLEFAKNGVV